MKDNIWGLLRSRQLGIRMDRHQKRQYKKPTLLNRWLLYHLKNYNALSTFPDRKHLVQTLILFGVPLTIALTLLKLGDQVLLLCRLE